MITELAKYYGRRRMLSLTLARCFMASKLDVDHRQEARIGSTCKVRREYCKSLATADTAVIRSSLH